MAKTRKGTSPARKKKTGTPRTRRKAKPNQTKEDQGKTVVVRGDTNAMKERALEAAVSLEARGFTKRFIAQSGVTEVAVGGPNTEPEKAKHRYVVHVNDVMIRQMFGEEGLPDLDGVKVGNNTPFAAQPVEALDTLLGAIPISYSPVVLTKMSSDEQKGAVSIGCVSSYTQKEGPAYDSSACLTLVEVTKPQYFGLTEEAFERAFSKAWESFKAYVMLSYRTTPTKLNDFLSAEILKLKPVDEFVASL